MAWSLNDIPWHQFNPSLVRPDLLMLVKAAALVEFNGRDYARYLHEIFPDDLHFQQEIDRWAQEEMQHGQALALWAHMADASFNFQECFERFLQGYQLPCDIKESVRGSRTGELVARCVVETGTSSYYTAIAASCEEPVLKFICQKIAADEFRHYKLFYRYLEHYVRKERIGKFRRLKIALGRIRESEDDELAYAFYVAHNAGIAYERQYCACQYMIFALPVYQWPHVERMVMMVLKAAGIRTQGWVSKLACNLAWLKLKQQKKYAQKMLARQLTLWPMQEAVAGCGL